MALANPREALSHLKKPEVVRTCESFFERMIVLCNSSKKGAIVVGSVTTALFTEAWKIVLVPGIFFPYEHGEEEKSLIVDARALLDAFHGAARMFCEGRDKISKIFEATNLREALGGFLKGYQKWRILEEVKKKDVLERARVETEAKIQKATEEGKDRATVEKLEKDMETLKKRIECIDTLEKGEKRKKLLESSSASVVRSAPEDPEKESKRRSLAVHRWMLGSFDQDDTEDSEANEMHATLTVAYWKSVRSGLKEGSFDRVLELLCSFRNETLRFAEIFKDTLLRGMVNEGLDVVHIQQMIKEGVMDLRSCASKIDTIFEIIARLHKTVRMTSRTAGLMQEWERATDGKNEEEFICESLQVIDGELHSIKEEVERQSSRYVSVRMAGDNIEHLRKSFSSRVARGMDLSRTRNLLTCTVKKMVEKHGKESVEKQLESPDEFYPTIIRTAILDLVIEGGDCERIPETLHHDIERVEEMNQVFHASAKASCILFLVDSMIESAVRDADTKKSLRESLSEEVGGRPQVSPLLHERGCRTKKADTENVPGCCLDRREHRLSTPGRQQPRNLGEAFIERGHTRNYPLQGHGEDPPGYLAEQDRGRSGLHPREQQEGRGGEVVEAGLDAQQGGGSHHRGAHALVQ